MKEPVLFDSGFITSEGQKFQLDVRFFFKSGGKDNSFNLSQSHIEDLEMAYSIDKLYMTGFIIYDDVQGDVSLLNGSFQAMCMVNFFRYEQEGDGNFDSEKPSKEDNFQHMFFVDNVEIVDNTPSKIRYCIHLVGLEYKNLLNQVTFTNYGSDKKGLGQIAKEILTKFGKLTVDKSFDEIKSDVTLNYISNNSDNVRTAIDYIMQKQFFLSDVKEQLMKFLVYNPIDDKYGIFQLNTSGNPTAYTIFISMNDTQFQEFTSSKDLKMASISNFGRTDQFQPLAKMTIYGYDSKTNAVTSKVYNPKDIAQFFGGPNNRLTELTEQSPYNITREVSEWNNNTNIYADFLNTYMNMDGLLLNVSGVINRRLMSLVNLKVDTRIEMSLDDSTKSVEENINRYSQLEGSWFITKVRFIIKANKGKFTQNLLLSRNQNAG